MQRTLENFQFDLEFELTMSELTGKSKEERNEATLMIEILMGTEGKPTAVVAAVGVADQTQPRGLKVFFAVWTANTAGRA